MIPEPNANGELPPGVHPATMNEIKQRYATNPTRRAQYEGLTEACAGLAAARCPTLWLNGSFITTKDEPGDYDAAFDPDGIDWHHLGLHHPELMDFDHPRTTQKRRYQGEILPRYAGVADMVDFFQHNRDGQPKGIIAIDLTQLT